MASGPLSRAYGYAQRAEDDARAVRNIVNTVWRGDDWTDEREQAIRDLLGDAMGAIVAVAEALEIEL